MAEMNAQMAADIAADEDRQQRAIRALKQDFAGAGPQPLQSGDARDADIEKPEPLWRSVWATLKTDKFAMISLVFIIFLVVESIVTALVPSILPYDPYKQVLADSMLPPSSEHWFGTDMNGRDLFSRVLVGTQISLSCGLLSVTISLVVGVTLGAIAGYKGGMVDTVIMRIMDMMLAIPSILLAITFMAAFGRGFEKAVVAIGLVSIPEYARIVRSQILSVKENDYVAAWWATPPPRSSCTTCSPTCCPPSSPAPRWASPAPSSTAPRWASWAWASSRPRPSGATCWAAAAATSSPHRT